MTLTGNISITFSNIPSSGTQIEWEVEIKQDGTGGRTVTWPAALVSPPVIDTAAGATTIVTLRVNDGGTVIRALVSSAADVSRWATFTAVTDINTGSNDILAVKDLDFDGPSSTILGLHNLDFFQATHSINSLAGEIDYQVAAVDFHRFLAGGTEIARFSEVSAGVYRLLMADHTIGDVKDIRFDVTATFSGAGAEPTIGYDSVGADLIFNAPTGASQTFTFNNVASMTLVEGNLTFTDGLLVIFNPDATNPGMNVGQVVGDPTTPTNGGIWYNATTNKFREGKTVQTWTWWEREEPPISFHKATPR